MPLLICFDWIVSRCRELEMSSDCKEATNVDGNKKKEILSTFKSLLVRELMRKKLQELVKEKRKADRMKNKVTNSPFVPSSQECITKFIEMSKLTANDIFIDIGCGDGRLLIAAAKVAKCKCIGIEIQDELIAKAKQLVVKSETSDLVEIIKCDFKSIECRKILKNATVIFIYLLQSIMPLITDTLIKSVQNGCRVISYVFDIGRNSNNTIKQIRINKWSYPSFGDTKLQYKDNKILVNNLHPDFYNKYGIHINKLEYCQLMEINNRHFEHIETEYDFILAKRYFYTTVSNYYQFRHYSNESNIHKLDILLQYRYNNDSFEAVKPKQIVNVVKKTSNGSKVISNLKLYEFPLIEQDFGWKNQTSTGWYSGKTT
eukprot:35312_1